MNHRVFDIIKSQKTVLIDFYADWCIPCKEVTPVLKEVKKEMNQIRILKVDVDRNPFLATHFKIQKLPTLICFKNGERLWTGEGLYSTYELKEILRRQLDGI